MVVLLMAGFCSRCIVPVPAGAGAGEKASVAKAPKRARNVENMWENLRCGVYRKVVSFPRGDSNHDSTPGQRNRPPVRWRSGNAAVVEFARFIGPDRNKVRLRDGPFRLFHGPHHRQTAPQLPDTT